MRIDHVRAYLPGFVSHLHALNKIQIVQSAQAVFLGGDIKNHPIPTEAEGAYDEKNDIIYLVADNLSEDTIKSVLLHELYHRAEAIDPALRYALSKFNSDIRSRYFLAESGFGFAVEKKAYQSVIQAGTLPKDRLNEFKAYLVSHYHNDQSSKNIMGKLRGIFNRFTSAIRVSLIKTGVSKSLDIDDLMAVALYGAKAMSDMVVNNDAITGDTITVDGVDRPTCNSYGVQIHPTRTGLINFWRWFGDSQIVDDKGRPEVMYHGTLGDFEVFHKKGIKPNFNNGQKHLGYFFTDNPDYANAYARAGAHSEYSPKIMPVYLAADCVKYESIQKITEIEESWPQYKGAQYKEHLLQAGHDGIFFTGDTRRFGWITEVVVFENQQIKSAIGNNGDFGPESNILMSFAGEKAKTANMENLNVAQRSLIDRDKAYQNYQDVTGAVIGLAEDGGARKFRVTQGDHYLDRFLTLDDAKLYIQTEKKRMSELKLVIDNGQPEALRQKYGWHQGVDKQWRFEISDHDAVVKFGPLSSTDPDAFSDWAHEALVRDKGVPLAQVLQHELLFKAYPMLAAVRVVVDDSIHTTAEYHEDGVGIIKLKDPYNPLAYSDCDIKSVLLHEIQHAIQLIEGFAKGGSPRRFSGEAMTLLIKHQTEDLCRTLLAIKQTDEYKQEEHIYVESSTNQPLK